jgi:hypothetical protein
MAATATTQAQYCFYQMYIGKTRLNEPQGLFGPQICSKLVYFSNRAIQTVIIFIGSQGKARFK